MARELAAEMTSLEEPRAMLELVKLELLRIPVLPVPGASPADPAPLTTFGGDDCC